MTEKKLKFALKVAVDSLIWIAENGEVTTYLKSQRAKATIGEIDRILEEEDE